MDRIVVVLTIAYLLVSILERQYRLLRAREELKEAKERELDLYEKLQEEYKRVRELNREIEILKLGVQRNETKHTTIVDGTVVAERVRGYILPPNVTIKYIDSDDDQDPDTDDTAGWGRW